MTSRKHTHTRRQVLTAAAVIAAGGATPALAENKRAATSGGKTLPELEALIAAHKQAVADCSRALHEVDMLQMAGEEPSKAARHRCDQLMKAEDKALLAVCSWVASDDAGWRAKYRYLRSFKAEATEDHHEEAVAHAIFRSLDLQEVHARHKRWLAGSGIRI